MRLHKDSYTQIVALYQAGETSGTISKLYGVSDVSVLNVLKKMGIARRDSSRARMIYPIWHEAFSTLTPESAYWIGFLMADGSVIDETKIQLSLKQDDKKHIEKFRTFLRTETRPIYDVPTVKACAIKVHSNQLVTDLAMYGVVRRKSLTAKALNGIDLSPNFWLGILDGDGCIDINNNHVRVRLYGSKQLMKQFRKFLIHWKIRGRNRTYSVGMCRSGSIFEVSLLGQRAINFLQLAYSESPVRLDRKYAIAEKYLHLA